MSREAARSRLRLAAGTLYYRLKRYTQWYLSRIRWASRRAPAVDGHIVYEHSSPLLRHLRNVDVWMQRNKVQNLRLAVDEIDGLIIAPGERFSFWRLIGPPTRGRGYLPGMVLRSGRVEPGIGGGLCQLSNLIYWMTLHTSLTVVERYRHSYDVFPDSDRTLPFGSGATCAYNYISFSACGIYSKNHFSDIHF